VTWWRRTHFESSMIDGLIAGHFKLHAAAYRRAAERLIEVEAQNADAVAEFGSRDHISNPERLGGSSLTVPRQTHQTLSLTDCRLSATVADTSRSAEKPRLAYGLD
jgi:hypothetical protein